MATKESSTAVREAERLRILAAACAGLGDIEVLQYALDQAIADLHGLSGMVHWCGPIGSHEPRLVVASGLPPAKLPEREVHDVIARALRDKALACLPVTLAAAAPIQLETAAPERVAPPCTVVLTAVPLEGTGGPPGVLSVLTDGPAEPTSDQRAFLKTLTSWLSKRLATSSAESEMTHLWWQEQPADSHLQKALKAVKIGSWDWDIRTGEFYWDEPALTLMGIDPGTAPHHIDTWVSIVHPQDVPRVMAATEEAVRTRSLYEVEYRACRPDGTTGWMHARGRLILDENGDPVRMIGTIWDTTESRVARESAGRALRYMSDAFLAVDRDWRITFVNLAAERLLGSTDLHGRLLWDLPAGQLPDLRAWCRRAAAERAPASFDVQWPTDQRWYHVRLVPVPDGLTLYLTDVTEKRIRDAERVAAEHAAVERAAWIQELTRTLGDAVTVEDVVQVITERVMPPFAAAGLIIFTVEHGRLHVVGAVGYAADVLSGLEQRAPLDGSALIDVLRTGVPAFIAARADFHGPYPDTADGTADSGMNAWAVLPLLVPGHPLGCCVISFDSPRRFTSEERTLLTALSGLIAQALARARMYDAEHMRAQQLQRLLLPRDLPSLPGITAAARYLPAGGTELGGDWYDIIPLSAERVALVIGDVMGHGLPQAATMGRLRTAVRTLADLDLPPDELLAHLNDLVGELGDDIYVTCLYAVYDPTSGECAFASAGHPPPVVVHPDGTVQIPWTVPDPPLGVAAPPFSTFELHVPEHGLFVLYTDGLVESATRDMDRGIAQFSRLLAGALRQFGAAQEDGLDRLCDAVADAMLPAQQPIADDAALLIARANRLPAEDVACWPLPEDPIAAGQARKHVRDQLATWHLEDLEDLVTTTELVASELVGNVIRHARGPLRLRLLRSRTLVCEVSDSSQTTPRIRRAAETDEGGRGLQLVAALSQRWGTRFTADGKCIWTEHALSSSHAAA
ncbi:SpoIIE family protein phosphatase [Nonomuraea sp. H19]|uniref:ATP-binding SpoIIE family protein phosphatase n=1 Tax=Nonomuraea sp. H19 TaxID=3452206 RepID=UPI003F8C66EF